jgi:glycogen debranching enzyme
MSKNDLAYTKDGLTLYYAGLPGFKKNFSRDSLISAIVMQDSAMLKSQLIYSASLQGKRRDPYSGEEPGKIHHESPGEIMRNRITTYNACDTTALYLLGHEIYQKLTNDTTLAKKYQKSIEQAIDYIKSHLIDNIFYEDPSHADADEFSLVVTYWKDSSLIGRKEGQPSYPVTYLLAHVQNMRGLISAQYLTERQDLQETIDAMRDRITSFFYHTDNQMFKILHDQEGDIYQINSDILQLLFYLDADIFDQNQRNVIYSVAKLLETSIGYRTCYIETLPKDADPYHLMTIWPFESALIAIGARKFGFPEIEKTAEKIIHHITTDPEILEYENGTYTKGKNDPQLWTIAAKEYFASDRKGYFP